MPSLVEHSCVVPLTHVDEQMVKGLIHETQARTQLQTAAPEAFTHLSIIITLTLGLAR